MKKNILLLFYYLLNGTLISQVLIKNISPGLNHSEPYSFYKFDSNRAIFFANDGFNGDCLFITDGSSSGTLNLALLYRNSYAHSTSYNFYNYGNATGFTKIDSLGFVMGATSSSDINPKLIRTNGTIAGTSSFSFSVPTSSLLVSSCSRFFKLSNKICWIYYGSPNSYLYNYDISTNSISYSILQGVNSSGLQILYSQKNYNSGVESTVPFNQQYIDEVLANNSDFFCYKSGYSSYSDSIFRFNISGTKQFISTCTQNLFSPSQKGVLINNKFLFRPSNSASLPTGNEPYSFDITNYSLTILKDINPYFNYPSGVEFIPLPLNNEGYLHQYIYFTAIHADYGREMWVTDGSTSGTNMIKDVKIGPTDGMTGPFHYSSYYHGDSLVATKGYLFGDTVRLITPTSMTNYPSLAPTFVGGGEYNYSWRKGNDTYILDKRGYIYKLGYSKLPIDTLSPLSCSQSNAALFQLFSTIEINGCLFVSQNDCNFTGYEPFKFCNNNIYSSLKEMSFRNENIILFPNPTNSILNVNLKAEQINSLCIIDVLGRELNITNSDNKINVSNLNTGTYFLKVSLKNNTSQAYLKFIKAD